MELEAITRQEQIIAGKDLQPVTRMEFFLKAYGGGGSSGGAQSDWNQNDSTAADYVKNRTHYEESIYTDYVLNSGGTQITGFSMPEVGGTITVKINGVESAETVKTGTSSAIGSYKYIGTIDFDSLQTGGTGWLVAEAQGQTLGFANPDTTINVENIVAHKLDAKYLPESVFKIDGEILIDEENGTYTLPDGIEHGISMIGKRFVVSNHLVYINGASADSVPVFLTDYNYKTDGSLSCSVICLLLAANGTYTVVNGSIAIT